MGTGKKVVRVRPKKNRTKRENISTVVGEWNHNRRKIEKRNKMRNEEVSTIQRNNGNNNHSQEVGGKRAAGDVEWYRESKICHRYKLLNENNGFKIVEGEQCELHAER